MKSNGIHKKTFVICFGRFGPYHHARVAALQLSAREQGAHVLPVQISADTTTYAWSDGEKKCEGLRTLCSEIEERASPLTVFRAARTFFRAERVILAFLPSYWPARYFALFAAAKSLGIRTVMMNESHAGTERARRCRRWIKRQIVRRFDVALVGGEPQRRHFASLGMHKDKIFTGYDAVDNDFFASRADEIRAEAKKSVQFSVCSVQQEEKAEVRTLSSQRPEAEHLSTLNSQPSTRQSVRSAYGLPDRYFLSLGRMVEKKNLSTLVEAYARFARASVEKHGAGSGEHGVREAADGTAFTSAGTRHTPVALIFVGSGELEGALRDQARALGLRVVERTDWRVEKTGHGLARIDTDKSERLAADRTGGDASCRVTPAVGHCPIEQTDDSAAQRGAVYFYGFRQIEENPVFYALAEAFVLPSLKEEWGLVVNEAMAAGLPVIVSRTAGCAEDLVPKAPASGQVTIGERDVNKELRSGDKR